MAETPQPNITIEQIQKNQVLLKWYSDPNRGQYVPLSVLKSAGIKPPKGKLAAVGEGGIYYVTAAAPDPSSPTFTSKPFTTFASGGGTGVTIGLPGIGTGGGKPLYQDPTFRGGVTATIPKPPPGPTGPPSVGTGRTGQPTYGVGNNLPGAQIPGGTGSNYFGKNGLVFRGGTTGNLPTDTTGNGSAPGTYEPGIRPTIGATLPTPGSTSSTPPPATPPKKKSIFATALEIMSNPLAVAGLGALGDILGNKVAGDAAVKAAAIAAASAKEALDWLKTVYAKREADFDPYIQTGKASITKLGDLMGLPPMQPYQPSAAAQQGAGGAGGAGGTGSTGTGGTGGGTGSTTTTTPPGTATAPAAGGGGILQHIKDFAAKNVPQTPQPTNPSGTTSVGVTSGQTPGAGMVTLQAPTGETWTGPADSDLAKRFVENGARRVA